MQGIPDNKTDNMWRSTQGPDKNLAHLLWDYFVGRGKEDRACFLSRFNVVPFSTCFFQGRAFGFLYNERLGRHGRTAFI
jgi:hypothetical protein